MHCPRCLERLTPERIGEASFYLCRKCRAVWVGMDALATLAGTVKAGDVWSGSRPAVAESGAAAVDTAGACPACGQTISLEEYAYNSGIGIWRCGDCRGIWLPVETLALIAAHLKHSEPTPGEAALFAAPPTGSGLAQSLKDSNLLIEGAAELLLTFIWELFD